MEIIKTLEGKQLSIALIGELNSITAPDFDQVIRDSLKDVTSLVLDFTKLEYLSSAGLRVLLMAQKIMSAQGDMVIKNANKQILDIFEMTGFANILNVERNQILSTTTFSWVMM